MLSPYTTIITFNGVGFDIPYLKAKADHYKIPEHFRDFEYLDIFKSVSSIKFLLKLENYKQKTIESFWVLKEKDEKTGGDLIHVYFTHVKHPTEETMHLLRIHNYEDVLHMIDLLSVLSYLEVLNVSTPSSPTGSTITTHMTEPKGRNGSSPCKTTIPFRASFPVNRIVFI